MLKAMIKKEYRLLAGYRSFPLLMLFFTLAYLVVGYGISRAGVYAEALKDDVIIYYMFVFPFAPLPLNFLFYPRTKDMEEYIEGGIENLVASGCRLSDIIWGKALSLFLAIYIPPAVMIIYMMHANGRLAEGLVSLLVCLPAALCGLSLLHVSSDLRRRFAGQSSSAWIVSMIFMLVLTYFPIILEKKTGQAPPAFLSAAITVLVSVIIGISGLLSVRGIKAEEII